MAILGTLLNGNKQNAGSASSKSVYGGYIDRLKDLRNGMTPTVPNSPAKPAVTPANPTTTANPSATSAVKPVVSSPQPSKQSMDYIQNTGLTKEAVTANLAKAGFSGTGMGASVATPAAPVDPKTTYLKTLRELNTPSEAETTASKALADLNSTIFTKKFEGTEKGIELFDRPGMLKSGAVDASGRSILRSNQDLARLATQQNAAANTLQALTGERTGKLEGSKPVQIGNDFFDPISGEKLYADPNANKGFELGKGETRYEYNEATGKYEPIASIGGGGSELSDESLMQFMTNPSLLNNLSPSKRSEVILAMTGKGLKVPNANSDALQAYQLADELYNLDTDNITGAGQFIPSLTSAATLNKYEQLKAVLSLENRAKLKGSGAVSDFEARVLESASSALGRNLSNEEFRKELSKVRGVLGTAAGLSVPVLVVSPDGKEEKEGVLDREGINSAIAQGFSVEYQ